MLVKTNTLTGAALDWGVAKCEGGFDLQLRSTYGAKTAWQYTMLDEEDPERMDKFYLADTSYSTDWQLGGPIIEQERISVEHSEKYGWIASQRGPCSVGPTPLVAAMRYYVASKLGEEVEIPEELYANC